MSQIAIRQHETAIRAAIGATRGRLFREVLTESVLLATCGGGVGVLLATWGVDAIVAAAPPNLTFNATSPIEVDGTGAGRRRRHDVDHRRRLRPASGHARIPRQPRMDSQGRAGERARRLTAACRPR